MEYTARKYNNDVLIAIIIIILPFFIYAHLLFSKYSSELIIFKFKINHWLDNNEAFIWFILNDLVPFGLLLVMFFTTIKKWRLFLFPLLTFYLLAILMTLNVLPTLEKTYLSFGTILYSLILVTSILVFDFYIAKKFRLAASGANLRSLIRQDNKLDISLILSKLKTLRAERHNLSLGHYFKKLFYLHLVIDKNIRYNNNVINSIELQGNRRIEKAIIVIIIFMTLLWFFPYIFPHGLIKLDYVSFTIDSNGFNDLRTFIWFVTRKFIVILFLSVWFITSAHWWKYAIFSPLIIFSYQFWEGFGDVSELDALSNIKVFPLVILNILVVIAISKWIKYRTDLRLIYDVICREVEDLNDELNGEHLNEIAKKYKDIKKVYQDKDIDHYKTNLKALEQEILLKLDLLKG